MRGFRWRSMRSKGASYAPVPQWEDPTRKAKDRVTSFESRIQKLETRRSRRRAHEGHEGEGHEDREDHATGVWYILKSSTGFTGYAAHTWGVSKLFLPAIKRLLADPEPATDFSDLLAACRPDAERGRSLRYCVPCVASLRLLRPAAGPFRRPQIVSDSRLPCGGFQVLGHLK